MNIFSEDTSSGTNYQPMSDDYVGSTKLHAFVSLPPTQIRVYLIAVVMYNTKMRNLRQCQQWHSRLLHSVDSIEYEGVRIS
jgi:hypothetical protein